MTHPSKRKGNAYERELVNQAREAGLPAERAYASNGRALGEHEEVDCKIAGQRIQAKRRAKIAAWIKPAGNHVDAQAVRENGGETFVILRYADYLAMLKKIS